MHKRWLDAVSRQSPKIRRILTAEIGDGFDQFVEAVLDGLIVISVQLKDDGLWYTAAVRLSDGLAPVARVHAQQLGLNNPSNLREELRWTEMHVLAGKPAPDDASELTGD